MIRKILLLIEKYLKIGKCIACGKWTRKKYPIAYDEETIMEEFCCDNCYERMIDLQF